MRATSQPARDPTSGRAPGSFPARVALSGGPSRMATGQPRRPGLVAPASSLSRLLRRSGQACRPRATHHRAARPAIRDRLRRPRTSRCRLGVHPPRACSRRSRFHRCRKCHRFRRCHRFRCQRCRTRPSRRYRLLRRPNSPRFRDTASRAEHRKFFGPPAPHPSPHANRGGEGGRTKRSDVERRAG